MLTAYERAVLTLFKAVPASEETPEKQVADLSATVRHGFYITEQAQRMCRKIADPDVLSYIEKLYGYDMASMNQGLYKNFHEVRDASASRLYFQQILHYLSVAVQSRDMTSSESIDDAVIYIPSSYFAAPNEKPVKITVIDYISPAEIEKRTTMLAFSGAALSENTLACIIEIFNELKVKVSVKKIINKELRARLYELYNTVPDNAADLLRYIIYLLCGSSLIIKNSEMIGSLKYKSHERTANEKTNKIISTYVNDYGIQGIAEEFFHYKPLWLALKAEASPEVKRIINQARKLAGKYHKNYSPQVLDRITSDPDIRPDDVQKELAKVTVFKKISILNGMNSALRNDTGFYFIRNGKVFAKRKKQKPSLTAITKNQVQSAQLVFADIIAALQKHVAGKTVYLPYNIDYALPASEKQMLGGIPFFTSIRLKKNIVLAIHWENPPGQRVDLDLHLNSANYEIGWNTQFEYNRKNDTILFSGDMTDAPANQGGATEAFYMSDQVHDDFAVIDLNRYTDNDSAIPFKFVIGNAGQKHVTHDYLLNCHKLLLNIPMCLDREESFLGFIDSDSEGNKTLYFTKAQFGYSIVSEYNVHTELLIQAVRNQMSSLIRLRPMLEKAGAVFTKEDDADWDIDLSPYKLTADTILSLLQ